MEGDHNRLAEKRHKESVEQGVDGLVSFQTSAPLRMQTSLLVDQSGTESRLPIPMFH